MVLQRSSYRFIGAYEFTQILWGSFCLIANTHPCIRYSLSIPYSGLVTWFATIVTWRVPEVEQELLTQLCCLISNFLRCALWVIACFCPFLLWLLYWLSFVLTASIYRFSIFKLFFIQCSHRKTNPFHILICQSDILTFLMACHTITHSM